MTEMARNAGLPWDCVLGAELVRHYKPDREVYQSAADFLDLAPADVMMVAAHLGDLRAAKTVGLKTAFVARPLEYGPAGKPDLKADGSVDVSARRCGFGSARATRSSPPFTARFFHARINWRFQAWARSVARRGCGLARR